MPEQTKQELQRLILPTTTFKLLQVKKLCIRYIILLFHNKYNFHRNEIITIFIEKKRRR